MILASLRYTLITLTLSAALLFTACGKKVVEDAKAQNNNTRAEERIDVAVAPVVERAAARSHAAAAATIGAEKLVPVTAS